MNEMEMKKIIAEIVKRVMNLKTVESFVLIGTGKPTVAAREDQLATYILKTGDPMTINGALDFAKRTHFIDMAKAKDAQQSWEVVPPEPKTAPQKTKKPVRKKKAK